MPIGTEPVPEEPPPGQLSRPQPQRPQPLQPDGWGGLGESPLVQVPPRSPWGGTPTRSAAPRAHTPLTEDSADAPAVLEPADLWVDLTDACSLLHQESRRRREVLACAWCVAYFALLVSVLLLQVGVPGARSAHRALSDGLVDRQFAPERTVREVRTIGDVWSWLEHVWVPVLFSDARGGGAAVGNRSVLAATPMLRQRRMQRARCGDSAAALTPGGWNGTCLQANTYSGELRGRSGAPYAAVGWQRPFADMPAAPGSPDFVAAFPVAPGYPWTATTAHVPGGQVRSAADAQAGLQHLRAEGWLSEETAFVSAHGAVYSPDADVLAVSDIVFTVSPAGHVITLADASSPHAGAHKGSRIVARRAKLYDWGSGKDITRFCLECVVLVMALGELCRELRAFCAQLKLARASDGYLAFFAFFASSSRLLRVLHRGVMLACVAVYAAMLQRMPEGRPQADGRLSLDGAPDSATVELYPTWVCLAATLAVLAMFRIVRHMRGAGRGFHVMIKSLDLALSNLAPYLMFFLIAVITYSIAGWYIYGVGMREFSTFALALQSVFRNVVGGLDFAALSDPLSGTTTPVFAVLFFWSFNFVMVLLFTNLFVALLVYSCDAALDAGTRRAQLTHYGGGSCSWAAFSYHFGAHPSAVLEGWEEERWVVRVLQRFPLAAAAAAEVVGGTNLRVCVTLTGADVRRAGSARGFVFVLPPHLAADAAPRDSEAQWARGRCLFTLCESGYEPRSFPVKGWCVLGRRWWMRQSCAADWYLNRLAGVEWTAAADGGALRADQQELEAREQWYEQLPRKEGAPAVAPPAPCAPHCETVTLPFTMSTRGSRVLSVESSPLADLLAHTPADWARQSIVFEFAHIVAPEWVQMTTGEAPGSPRLRPPQRPCNASVLARSQSGSDSVPPQPADPGLWHLRVQPLCITQAPGREEDKVVIVVGDSPVPPYVPAGPRERLSGQRLLQAVAGDTLRSDFVRDFIVARLGVASDARPSPPPPAPPQRPRAAVPRTTPLAPGGDAGGSRAYPQPAGCYGGFAPWPCRGGGVAGPAETPIVA